MWLKWCKNKDIYEGKVVIWHSLDVADLSWLGVTLGELPLGSHGFYFKFLPFFFIFAAAHVYV